MSKIKFKGGIMSENKKEGNGCGPGHGCGCCSGVKLVAALIVGAFIFAAGMWFAKAHCHYGNNAGFCPFSGPQASK